MKHDKEQANTQDLIGGASVSADPAYKYNPACNLKISQSTSKAAKFQELIEKGVSPGLAETCVNFDLSEWDSLVEAYEYWRSVAPSRSVDTSRITVRAMDDRREYDRQRDALRRAGSNFKEWNRVTSNIRKQWARRSLDFMYQGRACAFNNCGETCIDVLELHHVNPARKTMELKVDAWSIKPGELKPAAMVEASQECATLCSCCHEWFHKKHGKGGNGNSPCDWRALFKYVTTDPETGLIISQFQRHRKPLGLPIVNNYKHLEKLSA